MESVWIVPTRGRPANAERLAARWVQTAGSGTHLLFIIDDDDPCCGEYERVLDAYGDEQVTLITDERRRVGPTLNYWAPKLVMRYDAIGFMGDDHLPAISGWDVIVERAATMTQNFIAYGNDLIHGPNLPTAVVMDSRIIRALGYMVPSGLIHLYLDNFWRDLGEKLGTLSYHPDIVIEHIHPVAGRVEWDAGYREVNSGEMYASDAATYSKYVADGELAEAVARIRGFEDA